MCDFLDLLQMSDFYISSLILYFLIVISNTHSTLDLRNVNYIVWMII